MQTSDVRANLQVEVPEKIRVALEAYAKERDFSIDLVIELALSQFLDVDAMAFEDCDPVMTPGRLREENAILKSQLAAQN